MTRPSPDILYVITDLNVGGVPLHLHRLVSAMRARDLSCTVVSLAPIGEVGRRLRRDGVDVLSCEGRGGFDVRVIRRLARIMAETKPSLIHAMLFHANLASRRATRRAGIPPDRVICEIQTVEVQRRWHLAVDAWTHGGCRFTIGNSPSVVDHLATNARIPRDRLRLVRGGIDPAPMQTADPIARATLALPDSAPLVLWTGRLDPVKGLAPLIDAFASIAVGGTLRGGDVMDGGATGDEVIGGDAHLLLAGEGPMRGKLVRRITRCGLRDRVHLLGVRDDIPNLLKACDVFVFPSRSEGLPNALLEAMAASCAIVATDVPGNRDLIKHESDGLLVPYGDTNALAGAVRRLLCDKTLARRLSDAAFAKVTTSWQLGTMFNAYEALYREVLTDTT